MATPAPPAGGPRTLVLVHQDREARSPEPPDAGERLVVTRALLEAATGWTHEDGTWVIDGARIPDPGPGDEHVDLRRVTAAAGIPVVTWADDDVHVVVLGSRDRADEVGAGTDPGRDLVLPSIDGPSVSLRGFGGRPRVYVAVASWCGCRDDLPAWQSLRDELRTLRPDAEVVAVAIDESVEAVRPWAEGVDLPVLVDVDRSFTERYGVVNVPTVIWLDETDRVVRAPDLVFADNRLTEHHGLDATAHHAALREWLRGGGTPDGPPAMVLTDDERLGRTHFRLALWLWREGRPDAARGELEVAGRLDPEDLTVRRAGLALVGDDPFGPEFGEIYAEWRELTGGTTYRPR